jgi:hypothetical protein
MPLDVGFTPADVNNFFTQWLDFCYKNKIINAPVCLNKINFTATCLIINFFSQTDPLPFS